MGATCVYCHGRKGKRSCPALNGLICSTCCGENRLTKIACPADCPYLEAGTDYQRQRVGELFRQGRRRVYREIIESGRAKAAGLPTPIASVGHSNMHAILYHETRRTQSRSEYMGDAVHRPANLEILT